MKRLTSPNIFIPIEGTRTLSKYTWLVSPGDTVLVASVEAGANALLFQCYLRVGGKIMVLTLKAAVDISCRQILMLNYVHFIVCQFMDLFTFVGCSGMCAPET